MIQDAQGQAWLTDFDEAGREQVSYIGRRAQLDEIRDLQSWCAEQGISFGFTREALAVMARHISKQNRVADARKPPWGGRNALSGRRTQGNGQPAPARPQSVAEQREFATPATPALAQTPP